MLTTFIIPSLDRPTLKRAIRSVGNNPYLVQIDKLRIGAGLTRAELIKQAGTPWVSFLDDDDTVTEDYVPRLRQEIRRHPDADCVIFPQYHLNGTIFPLEPKVNWGNIGISYSVKTAVALEYPFLPEHFEDLEFIKRLDQAGKKIIFSKYLVYRVRH
jgi:hypothetical protein